MVSNVFNVLVKEKSKSNNWGSQRFWIWGDGLFIFRELGIIVNYFQGFGEQTHSFGDLGSPAKKLKQKLKTLTLKEKPLFC